jgi:large subunit ribosomal protein L13
MRETKTKFFPPSLENRKWFIVDADGQVLGRIATRISHILTGKNKPTYTPSADVGDFVVVINAEKVKLTGDKLKGKVYYHHTGWVGHLRSTTAEKMLKEHPERIIEKAVWGMTPKTRLGNQLITKLKVYKGSDHPHKAQMPVEIKF